MSFDDYSYKLFNDAILNKVIMPFSEGDSPSRMMLDDKRYSSISADLTRPLPLTVDKIRDLEEMSSKNGEDDGIDDSGQNLGSFLPSEIV